MARYRRPSLNVLGSLKSGLRTYNSMLYAGRATVDSVRKIRNWMANRKQAKRPVNPVVAKVRQRTRGGLVNHPTAFAKTTISSQQRRDALAKNIKAYRAKHPTKRKHTAQAPSSKLARAPRTTKITLESGITHNRVHGRIRRFKMRDSYVNPILASHKGDRKAAAAVIRANRKLGIKPKFKTHEVDPLFKKASAYIMKHGIRLKS